MVGLAWTLGGVGIDSGFIARHVGCFPLRSCLLYILAFPQDIPVAITAIEDLYQTHFEFPNQRWCPYSTLWVTTNIRLISSLANLKHPYYQLICPEFSVE